MTDTFTAFSCELGWGAGKSLADPQNGVWKLPSYFANTLLRDIFSRMDQRLPRARCRLQPALWFATGNMPPTPRTRPAIFIPSMSEPFAMAEAVGRAEVDVSFVNQVSCGGPGPPVVD
jgi:hypothetical protein